MPALLLAVALGLDNLAAALAIGARGVSGRAMVRTAVVFGLFEAGMPVAGLVLGHGLADTLGRAVSWLGGAVLVAFGAAGLTRAWRAPGPAVNLAPLAGTWRTGRLLAGGLVLSGDNLAAGFALGAYHVSLALAAAVFGLVSMAMTLAGLQLGARLGAAAGERSELLACALLVVVGAAIAAGNPLMELTRRGARPSGMMSARLARATAVAALVCSALAGCGSAATSSPAAAPATSSAAPATPAAAASTPGTAAPTPPAAGCAAVNQATSVTVRRAMHLVEPTRAGALTTTQHNAVLVRALFGQFCAAVRHPGKLKGVVHCPADFGISYLGTFYDGSRVLARFIYGASGCQTVSLSSGGKTQTVVVLGPASAAAPKLQAAMAAVLGVAASAVARPVSRVDPGGPNKPLRQARRFIYGSYAGWSTESSPTRRGRTRRP